MYTLFASGVGKWKILKEIVCNPQINCLLLQKGNNRLFACKIISFVYSLLAPVREIMVRP